MQSILSFKPKFSQRRLCKPSMEPPKSFIRQSINILTHKRNYKDFEINGILLLTGCKRLVIKCEPGDPLDESCIRNLIDPETVISLTFE